MFLLDFRRKGINKKKKRICQNLFSQFHENRSTAKFKKCQSKKFNSSETNVMCKLCLNIIITKVYS